MQRKYGKDGLVAVSVSVDDPQKKDDVDLALKFLREQDAEFTNLLLDESDEVWPEKLGSTKTPFIFVFGPDGRIAGKFEGSKATYEENVEPLVLKLLNK
jgi:hypothetical protein